MFGRYREHESSSHYGNGASIGVVVYGYHDGWTLARAKGFDNFSRHGDSRRRFPVKLKKGSKSHNEREYTQDVVL